jgi:hypothetical protein
LSPSLNRSYFRAARQALAEENAVTHRETVETTSLLKETAKKHMETETSKDGLFPLQGDFPFSRFVYLILHAKVL